MFGNSEDKWERRARILYPTMKDKEDPKEIIKNKLVEALAPGIKQLREDILYPTMKSKKEEGIFTGGAADICKENKKYIENLKEISILKKYERNQLAKFGKYLDNESKETPILWDSSNNAKFSDEELKRARKFIHGIEKFREDAYYPTPNDKLTIGYGHTGLIDGKPIKLGMKITEEKAEELYRKDFETHTAPLKQVEVPLTNNQKIALASFVYNLGPNILKDSDLLKKLNKGDYEGAADEFDKYIHQKNKKTGKYEVLNGLIDRRAKEKRLFLTPDGK